MGRSRTRDLPDLSVLLLPQTELMLAVEHAVLRNRSTGWVAASLAEQIAAKLAGVITLDLVSTGQRLLEQDISEVLEVSRAPVREALRILERDRLVEFQSRRGAIVMAPTSSELQDTFAVRGALYAMLLRQEVESQPVRLKEVFEEHLPRILVSSRESPDAYAGSTFMLNCAMAEMARNRTLGELLLSLSTQTMRYVRLGLVSNPEQLPELEKSWESLYKAVGNGDIDRVIEIAEGRVAKIQDLAVEALKRVEAAASD